MGINPNSGDGVEKNYTVDGRTDATSIVSDSEHTGQEAGKAFAHIAAQAESANKGTSDLSKRVAALEARPVYSPPPVQSISGAGWAARKQGNVVWLSVQGATEGWTLPEGWRPPIMCYAPVVDLGGQSPVARIAVNTKGTVTPQQTTGKIYGSAVFMTAG